MVREGVSLRPFTTLKVGGPAERLVLARSADELANDFVSEPLVTVLGWGSNVLVADKGLPGLAIINLARRIEVGRDGWVQAESGCGFQELFLKSAQAGLGGLEFAVGIPGTLGGALVSNAGAYRSSVSEFLTEIEVVEAGERKWVDPSWMRFSYRDSVLRSGEVRNAVILRVRMRLPIRAAWQIYQEAREYQRQRISKQPPSASAGSFFKNVVDRELAQRVEGLSEGMRASGVVPAGFLIEAVGLKGFRHGGAMLGQRHANFILNVDRATATEIRELAEIAANRVQAQFGVLLEPEVLAIGDWS